MGSVPVEITGKTDSCFGICGVPYQCLKIGSVCHIIMKIPFGLLKFRIKILLFEIHS